MKRPAKQISMIKHCFNGKFQDVYDYILFLEGLTKTQRANTIEEFKEKMRNLNQLNCFVDYIADEIDLEELMHYASEEIAELLMPKAGKDINVRSRKGERK